MSRSVQGVRGLKRERERLMDEHDPYEREYRREEREYKRDDIENRREQPKRQQQQKVVPKQHEEEEEEGLSVGEKAYRFALLVIAFPILFDVLLNW